MFEALRNHPFGVRATLERTLVIGHAAPKEELMRLLPSFLEPDTFKDRWGFIATAAVRAVDLRPSALPRWAGRDFWLIGHRIFVRYVDARGRRLRGLYILGSETDDRRMAWLGDRLTHYRYTYKPMRIERMDGHIALRTEDRSTMLVVKDVAEARLPADSVFADRSEARRFVGPLPFTFSRTGDGKNVLIVEGVRTDWDPRPVEVEEYRCDAIAALGLSGLRLSNAFIIDRVPYHWKPGRLEPITR